MFNKQTLVVRRNVIAFVGSIATITLAILGGLVTADASWCRVDSSNYVASASSSDGNIESWGWWLSGASVDGASCNVDYDPPHVYAYASGSVTSTITAGGLIGWFGLSPQYAADAWGEYNYCDYPGWGDPGGPQYLDVSIYGDGSGGVYSRCSTVAPGSAAGATGYAKSMASTPILTRQGAAWVQTAANGTPSAGAFYEYAGDSGDSSGSYTASPGIDSCHRSNYAEAHATAWFSVYIDESNSYDTGGAPPDVVLRATVSGDAESHVSNLGYTCDGQFVTGNANAGSSALGSGSVDITLTCH